MKQEVLRIVRHFGPVAVVYLVLKGYIPAAIGGPLSDAVIAVAAGMMGFGASKARDKKRA